MGHVGRPTLKDSVNGFPNHSKPLKALSEKSWHSPGSEHCSMRAQKAALKALHPPLFTAGTDTEHTDSVWDRLLLVVCDTSARLAALPVVVEQKLSVFFARVLIRIGLYNGELKG